MYSIYKHTAPNGKVYIGQTKLIPKKRWQNGFAYRSNKAFFADIIAFGWSNIKHEILEVVETKAEAIKRERHYILLNHSDEPERGYNKHINFSSMR